MGCGPVGDGPVTRRPAGVGVTLVELMVVLAVLGVMAGVVGLAWQPGRWLFGGHSARSTESIATVRRRAVESGKASQGVVTIRGRAVRVIALPDGRIVGAEQLGVNPLTGEAIDANKPAQ